MYEVIWNRYGREESNRNNDFQLRSGISWRENGYLGRNHGIITRFVISSKSSLTEQERFSNILEKVESNYMVSNYILRQQTRNSIFVYRGMEN